MTSPGTYESATYWRVDVVSTESGASRMSCSFCEQPPRWVVEGTQQMFRVRSCARHAHRALDMALLAGNTETAVTCAPLRDSGAEASP